MGIGVVAVGEAAAEGSGQSMKCVKGVLITGASGGIGRALCAGFLSAGWRVVATDAPKRAAPEGTVSVPCCLASYVADEQVREGFRTRVVEALAGVPLVALVNNAAVQHCGATAEVGRQLQAARVPAAQPQFRVAAVGGDVGVFIDVEIRVGLQRHFHEPRAHILPAGGRRRKKGVQAA